MINNEQGMKKSLDTMINSF